MGKRKSKVPKGVQEEAPTAELPSAAEVLTEELKHAARRAHKAGMSLVEIGQCLQHVHACCAQGVL
jgi:2,4-dienoyl-CoA reductase-like NADH-dependent reductase (Old Yellow Enzyme family)